MYRIHQIKLALNEDVSLIPEKIKARLKRKDISIISWEIIKESLDARDKNDIKKVYSIDFVARGGGVEYIGLDEAPPKRYEYVERGTEILNNPPVIVGFGPCGMFAGLILAKMGYRPIIIERGKSIDARVKDVEKFWEDGTLNEESNVQFGEGGAGTFSDGKLTTQIKDKRVLKVLREFVKAGAPKEIKYKQKPHIGTDVLRSVVASIRETIIENGGQIYFESKLTGISFGQDGSLCSIMINDSKEVHTENLVLALGHSARGTLKLLYDSGISMVQKQFSIGVRIEHKQAMINRAQYGKDWETLELGAADYKLSHKCSNGRGVYTFCMCPGGHVIASSSQKGTVVTNGMSYHDRGAENANSGLLVDVTTDDFGSDYPLAGVEFQEKYEKLAFEAGGGNYNAPAQKIGDFMNDKRGNFDKVTPTYKPGVKWVELSECLPAFATEALKEAIPALGKKLRGFDNKEAVLTGVETRSSSPVRILRNEDFESSIKGIYPGGEGAGYAGGIVSAAVDGIKIAEAIAKKYAKFKK